MKILWGDKDGGSESRVWVWGIESKRFGSILLMCFRKGSREAYHTHAFNAISWVLRGWLLEETIVAAGVFGPDIRLQKYEASWCPIRTPRERFHMVHGMAEKTWVLSFRGPWVDTWKEFLPSSRRNITLTHGRKEI